ncbi:MAG: PspC domain-containing protein [Bacteroidales bacterium]|nr:PspC domain-containing protein [Bacteroidales bacterium]
MKKVINASIGGRSFALDEDAYKRLAAYFGHFKSRLSQDTQSAKDEVMSDLEGRIAELFDQETGGAAYRVVNLGMVSRIVGQLGMPDGSAEPLDYSSPTGEPGRDSGSSAGAETGKPGKGESDDRFIRMDLSYEKENGSGRRLFRDPDNKAIGGVCSGLACFLNIDITIVRIIILLALLLWGSGLIVYLVLWVVVPLAKTPAQKCEMRGLEPTAENMAKFTEYSK